MDLSLTTTQNLKPNTSIDPKNDASRRVLEKIGFVYRHNEVQPGEEEESEIYVAFNPSELTNQQ